MIDGCGVMNDLTFVDADGDWWLAVDGSELAQCVLAAMRNAFMAASDQDGESPVYLVWAVVDAPVPEAVTGVIPAPSLDALQAYLYEEVNNWFDEAYPYEIIRFIKLEVGDDGEVTVAGVGTDPLEGEGVETL